MLFSSSSPNPFMSLNYKASWVRLNCSRKCEFSMGIFDNIDCSVGIRSEVDTLYGNYIMLSFLSMTSLTSSMFGFLLRTIWIESNIYSYVEILLLRYWFSWRY